MKCFATIVNGWIQSTFFAKNFILDVSLRSGYVSDYPEAFSIIINEASTLNLSEIFSFKLMAFSPLTNLVKELNLNSSFKYLEQKFSRQVQ